MANKAKPTPRGYRTATPYLIIKDAAAPLITTNNHFKPKF
jgi:hypothetical protein